MMTPAPSTSACGTDTPAKTGRMARSARPPRFAWAARAAAAMPACQGCVGGRQQGRAACQAAPGSGWRRLGEGLPRLLSPPPHLERRVQHCVQHRVSPGAPRAAQCRRVRARSRATRPAAARAAPRRPHQRRRPSRLLCLLPAAGARPGRWRRAAARARSWRRGRGLRPPGPRGTAKGGQEGE